MKRIFLFSFNIVFLFLLFSCNQNYETKQVKKHEKLNYNYTVLQERLKKETNLFIKGQIYRNTMCKNICYSIEFTYKDKSNNILTNDSIIYISTLNCNEAYAGYRGIINNENYTIAIIDNSDFGNLIYDSTKIVKKPIGSLKCNKDSMIFYYAYKIINGSLIEWNPK